MSRSNDEIIGEISQARADLAALQVLASQTNDPETNKRLHVTHYRIAALEAERRALIAAGTAEPIPGEEGLPRDVEAIVEDLRANRRRMLELAERLRQTPSDATLAREHFAAHYTGARLEAEFRVARGLGPDATLAF